MKFIVTNAGLSAAQRAQANGYQISLNQFKVGSAYNYTPATTDTALHGTTLHSGGISGFSVIDPNTVQYTCIMDQDVGTFNYGEIGLYLEDGTLFALAAQPRVTEKIRGGPGITGNRVAIEAQLKLTQAEAVFNFDVLQLSNAKLLELNSVAQLKPPVISDTNAYVTKSRDGGGSSVMAYKSTDFEWSFPNYIRLRTLTVGAPGRNYTSAPTVTISGGGGSGATATAAVERGSVKSITLTNGGRNYTSAPTVTISGGGGSGATATATIGRGVSDIQVSNQGQGYTTAPTVVISGGGGTGATATARVQAGKVVGITVTNTGSGYTSAPSVTLTGGGGSNATATATVSGVVTEISLVGNSTTSLVTNLDSLVKLPATAGKYMIQFLSGDLKGFVRQITVATNSSLHWDITEKTGSEPKQGNTFALYVDAGAYMNEYVLDGRISSLVTSTREDIAASSLAVKTAYDKAVSADTKANVANTTAVEAKDLAGTKASASRVPYTTDLDTITVSGMYGQTYNVNATSERHYPVQKAGSLLAMPSAYNTDEELASHQIYIPFDEDAIWRRNKRYGGAWSEWSKLTVSPSELTAALGSAVPSGTVMYFAGRTAPAGWLKANGAAVSRTTYASLFEAIGTTYGAGDGRTTFNLPDLRGEFIRGWDDGRNVDRGRAFGSAQADELKAHRHKTYGSTEFSAAGGEIWGRQQSNSGQYHDGKAFYTDTVGGSETRPRNVALLACIKI